MAEHYATYSQFFFPLGNPVSHSSTERPNVCKCGKAFASLVLLNRHKKRRICINGWSAEELAKYGITEGILFIRRGCLICFKLLLRLLLYFFLTKRVGGCSVFVQQVALQI